jgi:hypothetical protein
MKNRGMYRGIEDPIQGMFGLADEISKKSEGILFRSVFATIFVYFGLLVLGLLFIAFLVQGNIFFALVFLSVLITGIVTLRLLKSLREFLRKVTFRYSAIMAMRDGPPLHRIPKGRNATERMLSYLKDNNAAFRKLAKDKPELLHKDAHMVGGSGKRHHFDAYALVSPSLRYRLTGRGYPGYAMYIREYRKPPKRLEIESLVAEMEDIRRRNKVIPRRVIMVFSAPSDYSGLPESSYEALTEGFALPGKKGEKMNIQAVAEVGGEYYDFVPFIPELRNMLP